MQERRGIQNASCGARQHCSKEATISLAQTGTVATVSIAVMVAIMAHFSLAMLHMLMSGVRLVRMVRVMHVAMMLMRTCCSHILLTTMIPGKGARSTSERGRRAEEPAQDGYDYRYSHAVSL